MRRLALAARQQPANDTLVPHEGGSGYSTTGTGADYAKTYGPLLDRRNLVLVDQRGTGLSRPLRFPDLQNLVLSNSVAAGRCGRSLGDRAEVLARLGLGSMSLYGDSYGTFFVQTFAGRHPALVRSIVFDGAYPTYGESPPDTREVEEMAHRSGRNGGPRSYMSRDNSFHLAGQLLPLRACWGVSGGCVRTTPGGRPAPRRRTPSRRS